MSDVPRARMINPKSLEQGLWKVNQRYGSRASVRPTSDMLSLLQKRFIVSAVKLFFVSVSQPILFLGYKK
jgi:hypothetical protein